MALKLYNTKTRSKELFSSLSESKVVTLYSCGPTVYNFSHIGNMRAFTFADVLRRTLEANGYKVRQIINITDVGHLVSDGDEGEDKITKGALRDGISTEEVIARYTKAFIEDIHALNIEKANEYPEGFPRATQHIPEQLALIETLEAGGYAYRIADGIYFDTSKFPAYADFAQLDLEGLRSGARVTENTAKRNPSDFALWKFSSQEPIAQRVQEWDSPWGIGFPGWHIECSAMAMKYLGDTLDIHTGGIDHIPVHHTNEIAQSESATGVPFVRYWMHSGFMNIEGEKMSKSLGNTYRITELTDIIGAPITPLDFRYWLLTAHYRSTINFTKMGVLSAHTAHQRLREKIGTLDRSSGTLLEDYSARFFDAVSDDLNTPIALSVVHEMLNDDTRSSADKYATLMHMDQILGLSLGDIEPSNHQTEKIPQDGYSLIVPFGYIPSDEVLHLVAQREKARSEKDWGLADSYRDTLTKLYLEVSDTPEGPSLHAKAP